MHSDQFLRRLYGLCVGLLANDEEFAAELFTQTLRQLPREKEELSFHALSLQAAKILCAESLNAAFRDMPYASVQESILISSKLKLSLQALSRLDMRQRLLVLLRNQWGLGIDDLSQCFGISHSNVQMEIKAAQKAWRHQFELILSRKRRAA